MVVNSKESKTPSSLIELLGGSAKSKSSKTSDVFAKLLSSLNGPQKGEKEFNVIVDPKAVKVADVAKTAKAPDTAKTLNVTNVSKISAKEVEEFVAKEEIKVLPKELIDVLSNDQVKSLIGKAKEYLRNSIEQKSPEYKADAKTMPKTLMALVELADKMGIDMSEITLSTLDDAQKPLFKELPVALLSKSVIELKEPTRMEASEGFKGREALVALMSDVKTPQSEAKQQKEAEKTSAQPLGALLKGVENSPALPSEVAKEVTSKEELKAALPAHAEALGALLRGMNEMEKSEGKMGESKEVIKGLDESPKGLQASKADSLEVKAKEAVQSMRHFAIDLKEAAESYKPPFTRVTMKLNPEKLGEVEVTLVQRGNNVHVNIQSNNASSVAFLAHNATELKAQLAGQGITNATMNFMSGGESQHQNPQQHQQNRFQSYQSLAELESNDEPLSALEIILPHYA